MAELGFIQKREESDESFNLRVLSATISSTARELLEDKCSQCTHPDKFECLINPKCTLYFKAKRVSEDGIHFHWTIEARLKREDGNLTWAYDEDAWGQVPL